MTLTETEQTDSVLKCKMDSEPRTACLTGRDTNSQRNKSNTSVFMNY